MTLSPPEIFSIGLGLLGITISLYKLKYDKTDNLIFILVAILFIFLLGYLSYYLFLQPNSPPVISDLIPDRTNPQKIGAVITWTASANDPDNDPLLYMFLLNNKPITTWTDSHTYIWTTNEEDIGQNHFEVRVKDEKHNSSKNYDSQCIKIFDIIENVPPTLRRLSPNITSPQDAGTTVTWIADALDDDGDQILYRFFLNGNPMTDWMANNVWSWTTTDADAGSNDIDVQVRDRKHAGPDRFDSDMVASFTVTKAKPTPTMPANQMPVSPDLNTNLNDADAWYNNGFDLFNRYEYDEALNAYNKAIEINPQYTEAWNNKGVTLAAQGKYDEALNAYNNAVEINPQYAEAWNNKGVAIAAQGKYDEALNAYNNAVEINPQYAEAWNNKGVAIAAQGKYDEALNAYNKAVEINPQLLLAWNNMGYALQNLGRTKEADAAFAKAKELGYIYK